MKTKEKESMVGFQFNDFTEKNWNIKEENGKKSVVIFDSIEDVFNSKFETIEFSETATSRRIVKTEKGDIEKNYFVLIKKIDGNCILLSRNKRFK